MMSIASGGMEWLCECVQVLIYVLCRLKIDEYDCWHISLVIGDCRWWLQVLGSAVIIVDDADDDDDD